MLLFIGECYYLLLDVIIFRNTLDGKTRYIINNVNVDDSSFLNCCWYKIEKVLVVLESDSFDVLTGSCFFAHFHTKKLTT
jgi:hypothetical protein